MTDLSQVADSYWEGTFTGTMTPEGNTLYLVGHGRGGLKGLQFHGIVSQYPNVAEVDVAGYILDPRGE